ncbi:MAG: hypothetical protein HZC37_01960 [Burkholderiales bacterium]|nr:hypothetical protein [Burkholderiales bacterium]
MHKSHRLLLTAVAALGLGAAALPAFAVGAKCPDGSAVLDVDPVFNSNTGILRCTARAQAPTACPPSHPQYVVMPVQTGQPAVPNPPYGANTDFCRPVNIAFPAPSQVAPVLCPPGMSRVTDAGPGARDLCRATSTSQVPPLLIPN